MLFIRNRDVPGVVGKIGTILGAVSVNIAGIQLGRVDADDGAVSILVVDEPVPQQAVVEIQNLDEVVMARALKV